MTDSRLDTVVRWYFHIRNASIIVSAVVLLVGVVMVALIVPLISVDVTAYIMREWFDMPNSMEPRWLWYIVGYVMYAAIISISVIDPAARQYRREQANGDST